MAKQSDLAQFANALHDKTLALAFNQYFAPVVANHNNLVNRLACRMINTPGLAIGTSSKKKVKIVNECMAVVNGTIVPIAAATEVAFTATTHDVADTYTNVYVITVNAAGTLAMLMGTAALTTATVAACVLPTIPADVAVVGIVSIATAAAIFDATTTDLDAGTVTDLYYDCVGPFDPKASITV
jgi:hypothetical protein